MSGWGCPVITPLCGSREEARGLLRHACPHDLNHAVGWGSVTWGLLPWGGYSMVLSPPTNVGIEECKDVLGPCIHWLQGKMFFGKPSLQNKQVLIGSLFQMLFCTLIFGGQFSFPSYWENWLNSQSLPGPRDLSINGREGWRGKWKGKACLMSWNVWFLSLWDFTELFYKKKKKSACGTSESADTRTALASVIIPGRANLCAGRHWGLGSC